MDGSLMQRRLIDSRPTEVSLSASRKVAPFKGPAMDTSLGFILGKRRIKLWEIAVRRDRD
jgi:hypothetical protein